MQFRSVNGNLINENPYKPIGVALLWPHRPVSKGRIFHELTLRNHNSRACFIHYLVCAWKPLLKKGAFLFVLMTRSLCTFTPSDTRDSFFIVRDYKRKNCKNEQWRAYKLVKNIIILISFLGFKINFDLFAVWLKFSLWD